MSRNHAKDPAKDTPALLAAAIEAVPVFLSETELAGVARRSAEYVRHARRLGVLRPAGLCARSYLYKADAVAALASINTPVFPRRARSSAHPLL